MKKTTERDTSQPGTLQPDAGQLSTGQLSTKKSALEPCAEHSSPRLLVSVRNAAESLAALRGGASFIDIKEPTNGSLGRAPRSVHVEVAAAVRTAELPAGLGQQVVLTAALGELVTSGSPTSYSPVPSLSLYKLGLSQCGGSRDWPNQLDAWRERLSRTIHSPNAAVDLAAVAYADAAAANAPLPRSVLDYAIDRRLPFLLIDTFVKKTGSLTELLSPDDLLTLISDAHSHGISVALAGSLRLRDLRPLADLGADVLAVRGAACRHGRRELDLDAERIDELVRILSERERP